MIRARKITEHGSEDRKGVQVDITGEMGDVMAELDKLLESMEEMVAGTIEGEKERLEALDEIDSIIHQAHTRIENGITLRKMGLTEDELRTFRKIARSGKSMKEAAEEIDRIIADAEKRREAAAAEEQLAEEIREEKADE